MGLNHYPEAEIKKLGPDDVFSILLDPKGPLKILEISNSQIFQLQYQKL